jgi:hypothetical protein
VVIVVAALAVMQTLGFSISGVLAVRMTSGLRLMGMAHPWGLGCF